MARLASTTTQIEVVWSAEWQEFREVPVETHRRTRAELDRLDKSIEDYIADNLCTLRQAAEVFGIHNSTAYRRMNRRMGRRNDEVRLVWIANKAASYERSHAARKPTGREPLGNPTVPPDHGE